MAPFNLINSVSLLADISALYIYLRFSLSLSLSLSFFLSSSLVSALTLVEQPTYSHKKLHHFTRKGLTSR